MRAGRANALAITEKPVGATKRKSRWPVQHPDQRPVALMLCMARWQRLPSRNRGLPLSENKVAKKMKPVHPGEILREEFMIPLGLSMAKMAMALRVPVTRIADIVNERRRITSDTALRFARYFKN